MYDKTCIWFPFVGGGVLKKTSALYTFLTMLTQKKVSWVLKFEYGCDAPYHHHQKGLTFSASTAQHCQSKQVSVDGWNAAKCCGSSFGSECHSLCGSRRLWIQQKIPQTITFNHQLRYFDQCKSVLEAVVLWAAYHASFWLSETSLLILLWLWVCQTSSCQFLPVSRCFWWCRKLYSLTPWLSW